MKPKPGIFTRFYEAHPFDLGKSFKEGRRVGLDFYDLLVRARHLANCGLGSAESSVNTTRRMWTDFEIAQKNACVPGEATKRHGPSLSKQTVPDVTKERENQTFGRR
jgi:hypothetical protein